MPTSFLLILSVPLIVSWIAFITLFILFKKKGLHLNKKQSWNFKGLIIAVVLVPVFLAVFSDYDFIFDCRRETQKCEYYHSTLLNKELRLAETFDFSGATHAEIKKHYHYRKSGYREAYYKVAFVSANSGFEMPHEFSFYGDAEDEAAKISSFLANDEDTYHYERLRSKEGNILLYIMIGVLAEIIAMAGAILFGFNLFTAARKDKKKKKI